MKKLFGEINLTWKKLIIFAIAAGVYTAVMKIMPWTKDTSFEDIGVYFEWWILFGIIIICNSKNPLDSALKCFVFFLISQPLIYLIEVPFSWQGWGLFGYYKYWFIWTLACFPMGYIGHYCIKKNNILSAIVLIPMLLFLALLGLGYVSSVIENFPHHLLSAILCFVFIIIIIMNVLNKKSLKLICFITTILFIAGYSIYNVVFSGSEFTVTRNLEEFNVTTETGDFEITSYSSTKPGEVELRDVDEYYYVDLSGVQGGEYSFVIEDRNDEKKSYKFEYYFDKDQNTVILKETK